MHNLQGKKFLLFALSRVSGSKYCFSLIFISCILQSFFMFSKWCTRLVFLSPRKPCRLNHLCDLFMNFFMIAYLVKSIDRSFPGKITFWAFPLHYFVSFDFVSLLDFFSSFLVSFAIIFLNMGLLALALIYSQ